jgi:hypothetical protein
VDQTHVVEGAMARFEDVGAVCLGGDNLEPHGGWQLYSLSHTFPRLQPFSERMAVSRDYVPPVHTCLFRKISLMA